MVKTDKPITVYDRLSGIGCQFSDVSPVAGDIERTLVETIEMLPFAKEKGRLLKVLLSWIDEHKDQVIVEKLQKFLEEAKNNGSDVSYAALIASFALHKKSTKWAKLLKYAPLKPIDVFKEDTAPKASEEWALKANFLIRKQSIPISDKYTLSRRALARVHRQYKNRLMIGSQYRADVVTLIEVGFTSPSQIAKEIGCSKEPAVRIVSDLKDAGLLEEKSKKPLNYDLSL